MKHPLTIPRYPKKHFIKLLRKLHDNIKSHTTIQDWVMFNSNETKLDNTHQIQINRDILKKVLKSNKSKHVSVCDHTINIKHSFNQIKPNKSHKVDCMYNIEHFSFEFESMQSQFIQSKHHRKHDEI